MNKVALFDTAIGTSNLGDEIIMESCLAALNPLLARSLCIRFGTHIQNYPFWQKYRNFKYEIADSCDFKFILGTNLLGNDLLRRIPQWNINIFNTGLYKDCILMGVGTTYDETKKINLYTKKLYKKILSNTFIHSVRDDFTQRELASIGIRSLNTGCPTLWAFTPEKCRKIPTKKANRVVFTVSGYQDQICPKNDQIMLDTLQQLYDELYFFVQTWADEDYFKKLAFHKNVKALYSLQAFKELLEQGDIDYVGTRLHGGIYALQHNVRSLIISIDNRARGFHESNNIPILERADICDLFQILNSEFSVNITRKEKEIGEYLKQFYSGEEIDKK